MKNNAIPSPKETAVLGSLKAFATDPLTFMLDNATQHGDIFEFHMLNETFYLVTSPEMVREVLVTKARDFPKSPRDVSILGKFLGRGLVTSTGEFHKKQRKLMQPAFHMRRINAYAEAMVQYADEMRTEWINGAVRDISEDMMTLTMFIVSKTLFGADKNEMAADAEEMGEVIHTLQEMTNADYSSIIQWPEWMPTRINRTRKQARTILHEKIETLIAERKLTAVNGQIADTGDLLSMLLLSQDEDGQPMPDEQVRDEAVTLFVAGHETTSNALTWTWYLLAQHPEIEAKLHKELDRVLNGSPLRRGGSRLPTLNDLPNLPYTLMVIKESMRLYPPVWVLNGRRAIVDTTLGEYHIPKDSNIFISPYVMHRLPRHFENPEQFNPERFTPEREKAIPRYTYIPFGGGPRVCIGNSFAMMEAQLIIATLAQQYQIQLQPNQQVELNPLVTMSPKHGIKMRLKAREAKAIRH